MDIEFTDEMAADDEGLSVRAFVGGQPIVCRFSAEILQDVDPPNRMDHPRTQFRANRARLEQIARTKILAAPPATSPIWVRTADL